MMKHWIPTISLLGITLYSSVSSAAGLLTPSNSQLPALTLYDHNVSVAIEDGYAITRVDQVFTNPNPQDLEALYSFPIPDKAALAEFSYWIDGKQIMGEVIERKKAKTLYQQEKSAGREAGLAEQDSFKTFDIHVSPVRAKDKVRIQLAYIQPATLDTGIGRYVYPLEDGGVDEEKMSFWTATEVVSNHFSFNVTVKSAYPIDALRLPNHPNASIKQISDGVWQASIEAHGNVAAITQNSDEAPASMPQITVPTEASKPSPGFKLNQDLVLYWRHKPGLTGSVEVIANRADANSEGTFMMVITPGEDLPPISAGTDWTFILDQSGSMSGKYGSLTSGIKQALSSLRPNDRFRIILFNNRATDLSHGFVEANNANTTDMINRLNNTQPHNGTNLYAGLLKGIKGVNTDRTNAIVLVTDGVANVGETRQKQFLSLLETTDIRLFTFIMGNSANKPLLNILTRESNGFSQNISNNDDIIGQIMLAVSKVTHEAMHEIALKFDGVRVSDVTPKRFGSLYRGQQLTVFGHYSGDGEAAVTLTGNIAGKDKQYQTHFDFPNQANLNPEVERLWAYATIQELAEKINDFGEKTELKSAIIDIATQFSLVTNYTSMIVMREAQFKQHKIKRSNLTRTNEEHKAQQQRLSQAPVNHQVDQAQPMYATPRPNVSQPSPYQRSYGGGGGSGAVGPWDIILFLPLLGLLRRKSKKNA
ncbi:MAG: VWA domain-containing protein [Methylococcales bacterium]|jgi:Ca-activated chloride channel homolog|nr:VWA domain-containing protein [Methylococcales bacterium]MBT7443805.1 VWA domain-containing protein [Methylococcales bacterium]